MAGSTTRIKKISHHFILFTITGQVQRRNGLGSKIGFPTINLKLAAHEANDGVYAGYVQVNQQRFKAALVIGTAVLFKEHRRQLEAHLLDFNENLYGKTVTVEGIHYLRAYQNFTSVADLIQQIRQDIKQTRECLAASSRN